MYAFPVKILKNITCNSTGYILYLNMIKSFRHKGLEKLFLYDDRSRINPDHVTKIIRILDRLDASTSPYDMNLPGYRLHELKGKEKRTWSVSVSGNWRITFQFEGNYAINIDYIDYQ